MEKPDKERVNQRTWPEHPQHGRDGLSDRIADDLSKTPVNTWGAAALGGPAQDTGINEGGAGDTAPGAGPGTEKTPGAPEAPAAPQPRGSVGAGENAGAAAKADTGRRRPRGRR